MCVAAGGAGETEPGFFVLETPDASTTSFCFLRRRARQFYMQRPVAVLHEPKCESLDAPNTTLELQSQNWPAIFSPKQ